MFTTVRPIELRERCFRCQGFCHVAHTCNAADRSTSCFRYGETRHFFRDCVAAPDAIEAFRASLACLGRLNGTPKAIAVEPVPLVKTEEGKPNGVTNRNLS